MSRRDRVVPHQEGFILDNLMNGPALRVRLGSDNGPHHVESAYVERWWLPVIGPSSVVLVRLVAWSVDTFNSPVEWASDELAAACGLKSLRSLAHTIDRVVGFGLATWRPTLTTHTEARKDHQMTFTVDRHWPDIPERLVDRLPRFLQEASRLVP